MCVEDLLLHFGSIRELIRHLLDYIDYQDVWDESRDNRPGIESSGMNFRDAPMEICYSELLMIYKNNEYDMVNRQTDTLDWESDTLGRDSGRNRRGRRRAGRDGSDGLYNNGNTVYGMNNHNHVNSVSVSDSNPNPNHCSKPSLIPDHDESESDPWLDAYGDGDGDGIGGNSENVYSKTVLKPKSTVISSTNHTTNTTTSPTVTPYFMCNIEERIKISHLLNEYPHQDMSLYDKHVFCSCPLKIPDESVSAHSLSETMFKQWVWDFVKISKVKLKLKLRHGLTNQSLSDTHGDTHGDGYNRKNNSKNKNKNKLRHKFNKNNIEIPNTPEKLLKLETLHQLVEVYVWLGLRYPEQFYELEVAQQLCRDCSELIEQGITMNQMVSNSNSNSNRVRVRGKNDGSGSGNNNGGRGGRGGALKNSY